MKVSCKYVDESKEVTNIKWTFNESGVLTFQIDASATDKAASTVPYNIDRGIFIFSKAGKR